MKLILFVLNKLMPKNNISSTLIFCTYKSHSHIYRVCKALNKKYKIIVIENSLDKKFKKDIEKKYNNTKVIIPERNVGLSKSYNIGIKKCKTKYLFLNCPDVIISNLIMKRLINCAKQLKDFGILAPDFENTKRFHNYIGEKKKINSKNHKLKIFKLSEVNFIDNGFFMETAKAKKYLFDEKFFLYFEVSDYCLKLKKANEKLFISEKIRFKHLGGKSVDQKNEKIAKLTKAWHFNWSKFYYLKKNFNYFYAIYKIKNNFFSALRKLFLNFLTLRFDNCRVNIAELYGISCAIIRTKSFYRPGIK
tara:strand:+ start:1237 stop:2151 length:915 start_codon:yes stop_codon:yes gene_type:complete